MRLLILLALNVLVIGLFLYPKLLPHKDKLSPRYKSLFVFFGGIFRPTFGWGQAHIKPLNVGYGVAIDMTQLVFLMISLFLISML